MPRRISSRSSSSSGTHDAARMQPGRTEVVPEKSGQVEILAGQDVGADLDDLPLALVGLETVQGSRCSPGGGVSEPGSAGSVIVLFDAHS